MNLDFTAIDKTWSLFLDRDGVINKETKGTYVLKLSGFAFADGVQLALQQLSAVFGLIFVATNQRGIARGSVLLEDLQSIHDYMLQKITSYNGRIDKIYFCGDLHDDSPNRKPNPGMALQAKRDFPQVDFSKSIMVGNTLSDMQFARNAGMYSVFIPSTEPETPFPHPLIDARFDSLLHFAQALSRRD